jgi:hypothetical protein
MRQQQIERDIDHFVGSPATEVDIDAWVVLDAAWRAYENMMEDDTAYSQRNQRIDTAVDEVESVLETRLSMANGSLITDILESLYRVAFLHGVCRVRSRL